MQSRPPNAYQEVSNTNHFRSVSGSSGRLAVASQSMAGISNSRGNVFSLPHICNYEAIVSIVSIYIFCFENASASSFEHIVCDV